MEESAASQYLPYVALINLLLVSSALIVGTWLLTRTRLHTGVPEGRQNMAEGIMDFFYGQAQKIHRKETTPAVAGFLATCFLLILLSNAVAMFPIPYINYPPTAFFSITLGLALCAVIGSLALSGVFNGMKATLRHLVWPNPLQIISEITDVLSLSLRLFGNIAGEYLTLVLVSSAIAIGIPLILHVLGLIPTFVQALVFTLLTASFIAGALERHSAEEANVQATAEEAAAEPAGDTVAVEPAGSETIAQSVASTVEKTGPAAETSGETDPAITAQGIEPAH
jgi:F-type H+-transporting ATPase subunit a